MGFRTSVKIHFDEADPAGIAFSGTLFTKAHRCFEEFVEEVTGNSKKFFLNSEMVFPIRHTETEFFAPLLPLKTYQVIVQVLKIGESSFHLRFNFQKDGELCARVQTTHVCCDKGTMKKQPLRAKFKESLQKFVIPQ